MSTDIEEATEGQIDALLEDAPPVGVEVETPDGPVLMTPADDEPNPATDLEGAVLQEQQEAALEYGSEPAADVEERAEPEEDPESVVTRLALAHLYDVQDRLDAAVEDHSEKAEVAKTAKKRVESLQEDLSDAVRKLRSAKAQTEPDPKRYPLYDKAKSEINGMFAKPDSIAPLPADTFEEALRRKQRDTPLASMGLNDSTVKALESLGLESAFDIVRKFNELGEKGRDPGSLKGITANRLAGIATALEKITDECHAEWIDAHLAEEQALPPLEIAPGADYLVVCNSCDYTRPKSEPGPCPNGHVSGFAMVVEEGGDDDGR